MPRSKAFFKALKKKRGVQVPFPIFLTLATRLDLGFQLSEGWRGWPGATSQRLATGVAGTRAYAIVAFLRADWQRLGLGG